MEKITPEPCTPLTPTKSRREQKQPTRDGTRQKMRATNLQQGPENGYVYEQFLPANRHDGRPGMPQRFFGSSYSKVNHGQRQGQTQVDILNNMIGNPARFNGLPRASMSNDNLFWRLLGLVRGT